MTVLANFAKEALSPAPRIVILGREELQIENITGISSFSDKKINFRTPSGIVSISGENLVILRFDAGEAAVCGLISSISYI